MQLKLSLLIPVYNEASHIEEWLDQLARVEFAKPCEWVIIDDQSQDNSCDLIKKWLLKNESSLRAQGFSILLFEQPQNGGKGAAIQKAIELAHGEVLIVQDADFEYDPREITTLVEPIFDGRADIVYGSRFKKNAPQVHRTFHYFVNRFLTLLSNLFSGIYVTDMETCYKAFRADILKNIKLKSRRFGFEPEITAHLSRLKVRVLEFPISYFPRSYIEGKKISWKDGLAAVWHIFYFNLVTKDKDRFKAQLPAKYIPSGRQWL